MKKYAALFTVILLMTSCSSMPDKEEGSADKKNRAAEFAAMGNSCYNSGQYESALYYFDLSLAENRASDHIPGIIKSQNSIAKTCMKKGDFQKAEENLLTAKKTAEEKAEKELRLLTMNNLGELYILTGDGEKAVGILEAALREISAPEEKAYICHTLGIACKKRGDYEQFFKYTDEAIKINREEKNHLSLADNYYSMASFYSLSDNTNEAEKYLLLALDIDRKFENSLKIGKDYKALGRVYRKAGRYREAEESFAKALKIFEITGMGNEQKELLKIMDSFAKEAGSSVREQQPE